MAETNPNEQSGGTATADPPGDNGASDDGDKTFTQEDLTRIATREAEQAKRATERAIGEQLGMSVEDAKKLIAERDEREKAAMTEAERKLKEAEEAAASAERATVAATETLRNAEIVGALARAGVTDPAKRDEISPLALRHLDGEATGTAADEAVAKVKKTLPELFSEPKPPSGDLAPGMRPVRRGGDQETAAERGRKRARQYQGKSDD